ncbi:hypothetical protein XELAEV_18034297mg, partial [Xenopus laevis]
RHKESAGSRTQAWIRGIPTKNRSQWCRKGPETEGTVVNKVLYVALIMLKLRNVSVSSGLYTSVQRRDNKSLIYMDSTLLQHRLQTGPRFSSVTHIHNYPAHYNHTTHDWPYITENSNAKAVPPQLNYYNSQQPTPAPREMCFSATVQGTRLPSVEDSIQQKPLSSTEPL